jgi:hypothetical protein
MYTAGSSSFQDDEMFDWSKASGMSPKNKIPSKQFNNSYNRRSQNRNSNVQNQNLNYSDQRNSQNNAFNGFYRNEDLNSQDSGRFKSLNDAEDRKFPQGMENPRRMKSIDNNKYSGGQAIRSANLNRNADATQFYSEKRKMVQRSSSIQRASQLRMPLNKIPEVDEEHRAKYMTNSGNQVSVPSGQGTSFLSGTKNANFKFESTIKKGDIFKNQDLFEEDISMSSDSDDLGDEGDISELRANKNLKSVHKKDHPEGYVFEFNGISTDKKNKKELSSGFKTGKKSIHTPNKNGIPGNNAGGKPSQFKNMQTPPQAVRNLNNMFQAFDSGTKNLES